ncbi:MAG: YciI family protein [Hyphomonadaceae bacterium]
MAVLDGPFAELKEVIIGFDILRCDSLEEAQRLSRLAPDTDRHWPRSHGSVKESLRNGGRKCSTPRSCSMKCSGAEAPIIRSTRSAECWAAC